MMPALRIRQRGLRVVDVRDDTHGPAVVDLVHDLADLIHGEIRHQLGVPRSSLQQRFVQNQRAETGLFLWRPLFVLR